jgi:hypothetical protein
MRSLRNHCTRRMSATAAILAALSLAGCGRDAPGAATEGIADAESPADLAAMAADVRERVERLSGLRLREPLRIRRQPREAASRYVEERLAHEMPPERLEGARLTYATLGLLPDTLDLRALLLELYTEQVLGYYDPGSRTLYLVEGADTDALRPVLVHEMVHALQDQHTDIEALVAWERGADRQAAAHAALEGHAMIVMFTALAEIAARRALDPLSLPNPAHELGAALEEQNEQFPVFRRAPRVIRETLLFPYIHGTDFVYELWRSRQGEVAYPAPLDTLLPASTAQVMQPAERFIRGRADPVELRFDGEPGGWRVRYENTFGQLETAILLAQHGGEVARRAAQGWAGDRYRLLQHEDGALVFEWTAAWRDPASADRFAAAARALDGRSPERRTTVERLVVDGHPAVRVVDAPAAAAAQDFTPSAVSVVPGPGVAR